MSKVLNTKEHFVPTVGEMNGFEFGVHVESAGYRTARSQIEGFLYAGERLKASRSEAYDSDEYEPEDDPSLEIRDHELSEIGMDMQRSEAALERSSKVKSSGSVSVESEKVEEPSKASE